MNKNVRGLLVVLIMSGVVYIAAKKTGLIKSNKQIVIDRLGADFGFNPKHKIFVESADKEYINSWAKAIKNKEEKFFAQGVWHLTKGGTSVK